MRIGKKPDSLSVLLGFSLVFLLLFKPDMFDSVGFERVKFYLEIILIFVTLFIVTLMYVYRTKISKITLVVTLTGATLVISTISVGAGFTRALLTTVIPPIIACLFVDFGMQRNPFLFIKSALYLFSALFIINFISMLLYPDGAYITMRDDGVLLVRDNWFMGGKNTLITSMIPLLSFSLMYNYITKNRILSAWSVFLFLLTFATVMQANSASSLILIISYTLFLFLVCKFNAISSFFTAYKGVVLFLLITASIVFFRLHVYFAFLIEDVLNRNLTLTGRTILWDFAIEEIMKKPFLGYGVSNYDAFTIIPDEPVRSPHSAVLDYLYQGGLLMFSAFIAWLLMFCQTAKRYQNSMFERIITVSVVMLLCFRYSVNPIYGTQFIWLFAALITYIPQLENAKEVYESIAYQQLKS